jgi:DNA polymerase III subunit delta'
MTDPWRQVVSQARAVATLQRALVRPAHAYLIAGPRGADAATLARAFAAALVATDGDERAVDLVERRLHPDVIEFEPERTVVTVDQARDEIIPEVWRAPIEGARKVVILLEAERLQPEAANALLKTLEEPPERTTILLVSEAADELPDTIRSRCQRVELGVLADTTIEAALVDAGTDADEARLAARLSGGQLGRARELAGDSRALRDAFVDAAESLDGTGAAASRASASMLDAVHEAIAAVKEHHADELASFDESARQAGYDARDVRRFRRRIEERQPARERLARRKALGEGIAALESLYRDSLAGRDAPRRNLDREPGGHEPRACVRALDALREARDALEFNPNESLLLERLVLHLPASTRTPTG